MAPAIYAPIIFSSLGLCFLVYIWFFLERHTKAARLDKYSSSNKGFSDLLNYASVVEDGIIVNKNGSFMASWEYTGSDIESSTDAQRDSVTAHINKAFGPVGSGWMLHINNGRKPVPGYSRSEYSCFPNPLTKAIDDNRRDYFEHIGTLYEGKFVITLTWFPELLAERKFIEFMFDDDSRITSKKYISDQLIESFKHEVENFEYRISSVLKLKRLASESFIDEFGTKLTYDHFLSHLHSCITGIDKPVILPNNPSYIDNLIGGVEAYTGVIPKIGGKFLQVVSIDGYPFEAWNGILNSLSEIPTNYRWSTRYIFLDRHEAVSYLEDYRRRWKQKERGFIDQLFNLNGPVDEDAAAMVRETDKALADVKSGAMAEGYHTSVIVLMDDDKNEVIKAAKKVKKIIDNLGFTARIETINTMEAYFGSLPGHGYENIRRPFISTENLADLIPVNTIWTGENKAPCPLYPNNAPPLMYCVTSGSSPFRLNLHVRDLGHTIIFGPTRTGKSTLLAMIALQFQRYPDAKIFAFDKGLSMFPACMASDGDHYDIGESKLSFSPLSNLSGHKNKAWALEWIETILALNNVNVTAQQRNEIARALQNMEKNNDKTLSEFIIDVQDVEVRTALKQYSIDGLLGYLLDADHDGLDISNFMVFEIERLMGMGEKFALPVLLYLFHRIESALDGSPTAIILDEAWLMLGHPVFKEKIREWLKAIAKKNAIVIMATQNLSDASRSGILDVIVESTATKIFLPNPHAMEHDNSILYRSMGLNDKQIELISWAVPKRDYYYVSEKGSRMFSLGLGKLELAFAGRTDLDSIDYMKSLIEKYGEAWLAPWLQYCGVKSDFEE